MRMSYWGSSSLSFNWTSRLGLASISRKLQHSATRSNQPVLKPSWRAFNLISLLTLKPIPLHFVSHELQNMKKAATASTRICQRSRTNHHAFSYPRSGLGGKSNQWDSSTSYTHTHMFIYINHLWKKQKQKQTLPYTGNLRLGGPHWPIATSRPRYFKVHQRYPTLS